MATPDWKRAAHPDLIGKTRGLLAGVPGGVGTVIENVPGVPVRPDVILTGPMCGLDRLWRRRLFELNFLSMQPRHRKRPADVITVTRRLEVSADRARAVMGISNPYMSHSEIGNAVPPAYAGFLAAEWIGGGSIAAGGNRDGAAVRYPRCRIQAANVSTVPIRSPLRYPGGKTWLTPQIRAWLAAEAPAIEVMIEPFAGGASASLTAVSEGWTDGAILIERDRDVAAFWRACIQAPEAMVDAIRGFDPDRRRELLESDPADVVARGFRCLIRNRFGWGGILHREAGAMSRPVRWYPDTLIRRIEAIRTYAHRLAVTEGDAMTILPGLLRTWGGRAAVFVDPPYMTAGPRLYRHACIDHRALFAAVCGARYLMTYEPAREIADLIESYHCRAVSVAMTTQRKRRAVEWLITPDPIFARGGIDSPGRLRLDAGGEPASGSRAC